MLGLGVLHAIPEFVVGACELVSIAHGERDVEWCAVLLPLSDIFPKGRSAGRGWQQPKLVLQLFHWTGTEPPDWVCGPEGVL